MPYSSFPTLLHMLNSRILASVALAVAALGGFTSVSNAQTVISSVPYTIANSGAYVVDRNLIIANGTLNCITINAPNVDLDLGGFFVSGPGSIFSTSAASVFVADVSNVTVRNGTLANNAYGIRFTGGATNGINYRVENVVFTRLYLDGILTTAVNTSASLIRNCFFSQIGGSTTANNGKAAAICCSGGWRIDGCVITNVFKTPAQGSGLGYGIDGLAGSFYIGNTISTCDVGLQFGKYQNNLTSGCATPFQLGTDAGGNN